MNQRILMTLAVTNNIKYDLKSDFLLIELKNYKFNIKVVFSLK